MTGRSFNPLRLIVALFVFAAVGVGLLVVVVIVVALGTADSADGDAAPPVPADLCAVVGRDEIADWVPGGEARATAGEGDATCEATSPEGGPYHSVRVDVTRYTSTRSLSAESRAEEWFDLGCGEAAGPGPELGDDSCLEVVEAGTTGRAEVTVRRGGDLVQVSVDGDPLTADEAEERVVSAASRALGALD